MSHDATNAVYEDVIPTLRARLRDEIDIEHRPGFEITRSVLLFLADKYQPKRTFIDREGIKRNGYVNESVEQIMTALGEPASRERSVKMVLSALDFLGLVTAEVKGNKHSPTKRRMRFVEPAEQVQADLHVLPDEQVQADLPEKDGSKCRSGGEQVQVAAEQVQADLHTPPSSPVVDPGSVVGVISRDNLDPFDEPAPADVYQLARTLVINSPSEIDGDIRNLIADYGEGMVMAVVKHLTETIEPVRLASVLAQTLKRAMTEFSIAAATHRRGGTPETFVPADTPAPIDRSSNTHADCPAPCDGHGNFIHEHADGTTTVEPNACPIGATLGARHLKAVGA